MRYSTVTRNQTKGFKMKNIAETLKSLKIQLEWAWGSRNLIPGGGIETDPLKAMDNAVDYIYAIDDYHLLKELWGYSSFGGSLSGFATAIRKGKITKVEDLI